jgi:Cu-processing system ATP-binding protein
VFGLLGPNGAGKTTTILMLLGLTEPTAGTAKVDGIDPTRSPLAVKSRVGYLPDDVGFYDDLTARQNLRYTAELNRIPKQAIDDRVEMVLEDVRLVDDADRKVGEYSRGMRQRLGVAQALLGRPRLLLLDEPTGGLDPEGVRAFYGLLGELKADGVTVVLSSHGLAEIQERVDRLAIMVSGHLRAVGTVRALRAEADLPLSFRVVVSNGAMAGLRAAIDRLPVTDVDEADGVLRFRSRRAAKMDVLATVAARAGAVVDIDVREPSLEDVFFGVAD